ncbi:MAG: PIN domain-containing protein [Nitrospiraceae bacterium]|nr:PIN domain-containing protein [Nitrospiraceae bacterium]
MKLPKKIIDANVILRFFLEDDEGRFLRAKAFMQRLETAQEDALITEIVFAEVVWVLNKVYSIPRKEISDKFSKVLNYKGIKTILDKKIFIESLKLYAEHSMDIQDIFLAVVARSSECSVITFDRTDFKKLHCSYEEP